ncbi:IclR family transcriptional regulator [Arthrobacter sunyaminii]|uniref:IclR family transcriptional regulator n=1 Tax=Arthrobacter sunyaminii TaxID=2816859 RepID=A0A975XLA7_9MICC|nr:IclR family transcriptional regulator [Arthrobacter sunyaminii]MBO0907834.1 IclR family transcriptional regulator [Arthrobacter sunyaminii]QWQ36890.1 IclR family transcriptional regulator [Arthrobacter sunyaminii]
MAGSATADQNEEAKRSVLGRAFEILDCFEGGQEMTVSGICEQTGLPPATVHRMLAALVEWEGVERLARGRYRLGARIWRLGVSAPQVRRLRELAQPYLVNLHMATRGTVYLGVRDGQDAVFGDRITRVKPTAASSFVTRRMPLQSTAGGRVLLAYSDDAWQQVRRNAALAAGACATPLSDDDGDAQSGDGLTRYPGGLAALERELAAIRAQGYGVIRDDGLPGRTSVAAPVFGELGTAVASLTVSFPETRIPEPRTILPHVLGTARAISADLSRHSLPASAAGPAESAP